MSKESFSGRPDGSSVSRTVLNLTMSAVGTSVFALPSSFSKSGFVAVIPLLLLSWVLTQYMMSLLYRCMMNTPGTRSYTDLGFAAGGRLGKSLVSIAMHVGLGCICVAMILLMADATASMSRGFKSGVDGETPEEKKSRDESNKPIVDKFKCISAGIMGILSLLPTFKEVGIISAIGVLALAGTLITTVIGSSLLYSKGDPVIHAGPMNFMEVCGTFNMFMNGFTVAPVIPSLVLDMKDPSKFGKVLNISFALVSVVFLVVGYTYLGIGDDLMRTKSPSVTAIIAGDKSLGACSGLVQWGTILICICHFLCLFAPLAAATDNLVGAKGHFILKSLARLFVVGLCLAGAFVIPKFNVLIEIVACTIVPLLQLIFPIWVFCRLLPQEAKRQRLILVASGALGAFTVVVGLILAQKNLASAFQSS